MKTAFLILLAATVGCHTVDKDTKHSVADASSAVTPVSYAMLQDNNTLAGKWQLLPALPSDTATGKIPALNFILDSKRVTGNTGCNSFSRTFNINKNSLTFNNDFVSTRMACPGYDEQAFEKNLLRTDNYEINEDTLSLKVNQTPLSYWIRVR